MTSRDRRRRRGRLARWGPVLLVLAILGAAVASYHWDLGTRWLGASPAASHPVSRPAWPSPGPARPVARPAPVSVPPADAVRRTVDPLLGDPKLADVRAVVAPVSGPPLVDHAPGLSMPASTLKLLTASAALHVLGPDRTFATRVVRSGGRITLVGGGDPYLSSRHVAPSSFPRQASLQDLARDTARTLRTQGITQVRLAYDTSLFSGPSVDPHWPKTYIPEQVVTPITSLWADQGLTADRDGRVADPARTAALYYASYLRKDGVRVVGRPLHRTAPAGAREVARVTSAPLRDLVEQILRTSDNEGAEVLARQVGAAVGGDASFAGGVAAVRSTMRDLGVDLRGARMYDGSGLSRDDRLDPRTIVQVLQLAAAPDHPELRPVITGLPVAAYDGSLTGRFERSAGRGWVRAKTGTLTGTSALAGLVTDTRGRTLVFAFVSNHIPVVGTLDARAALDHLASALASCRC